MYKRILVAVEHSPADRTIVTHVTALAKLTGAELLLVHVADGFAARNFDRLKLRESEEMKEDRAYLESLKADLMAQASPSVPISRSATPPRSSFAPPATATSISSRCPRTATGSSRTSSTAPPPTACGTWSRS